MEHLDDSIAGPPRLFDKPPGLEDSEDAIYVTWIMFWVASHDRHSRARRNGGRQFFIDRYIDGLRENMGSVAYLNELGFRLHPILIKEDLPFSMDDHVKRATAGRPITVHSPRNLDVCHGLSPDPETPETIVPYRKMMARYAPITWFENATVLYRDVDSIITEKDLREVLAQRKRLEGRGLFWYSEVGMCHKSMGGGLSSFGVKVSVPFFCSAMESTLVRRQLADEDALNVLLLMVKTKHRLTGVAAIARMQRDSLWYFVTNVKSVDPEGVPVDIDGMEDVTYHLLWKQANRSRGTIWYR